MAKRGAQGAPDPFDYLGQWSEESVDTEIVLPSGKKIRVRTPDLPALAKAGLIPNPLLATVEKFVLNERQELQRAAEATTAPDLQPGERLVRLAEFDQYVDAYCVASVSDPPLSFDGAKGTLRIDLLRKSDRYFIYHWGEGLVAAVATFPGDGEGEAPPVPAPPDEPGIRGEAE